MPVQFRNVQEPPETLGVQYGVLGKRIIVPDGLVTVTDEAAPAYERQPLVWRRNGAPAPAKAEAPPLVQQNEPTVAVVQPSAPAEAEAPVVKNVPEVTDTVTEAAPVTPAEVVIETGSTSHSDVEPDPVQTEQASEPAPASPSEAQEALLDKEIAELEAERAALAAPSTEVK